MPDVRPIRTESDYEAAAARVEKLWGAESGTEDADLLDVLMVLVSDYEKEHHALGLPDPIEAIKIRMEETGTTRERLGAILGVHSGRVSEILGRRRPLTLKMIRTLSEALTIPVETLVEEYPLASERRTLAGPSEPMRHDLVAGSIAQASPLDPERYSFEDIVGRGLTGPLRHSYQRQGAGQFEPLTVTVIMRGGGRHRRQEK